MGPMPPRSTAERSLSPVVELESVSFEYAAVPGAGVHGVDLTVGAGEIVVVCGPSGSGKSTVTRIVNGLASNFFEGALSGRVSVAGVDVPRAPITQVAQLTGSVFQDPRTQFFTGDTISELAFGPENLGWDPALIQSRMDAVSASLGLAPLLDRSVLALSGGEQQRLACAVASMADPAVLLLDEPSSTLDGTAVGALTEALREWKSAGKAILVAEHRLDYLAEVADRFVYFDKGRITGRYSREEFLALGPSRWEDLGLRSPLPLPIEGAAREVPFGCHPDEVRISGGMSQLEALHLQGVRVRRGKRTVLDIGDVELPLDQPLAIVGANGSGKSTLARWLAGLGQATTGMMTLDEGAVDRARRGGTPPTEGRRQATRVRWGGIPPRQVASRGQVLDPRQRLNTCYLVAQNTNNQLFTETVLDEILLTGDVQRTKRHKNTASDAASGEEAARRILKDLDLDQMADRHPLTLSGGERQRLVIAVAMASNRRVVILDEPTSGLDATHMRQVAAGIRALRARGAAVIVITHDADLVALTCGSVVRLAEGRVAEQYALDEAGLARIVETLAPASSQSSLSQGET